MPYKTKISTRSSPHKHYCLATCFIFRKQPSTHICRDSTEINDKKPKNHIKNKQNMKKILFASALISCVMGASAQNIIERPSFGDNWQIGIDAGLTTPLRGHSFFGNMRPTVGLHIGNQLTPIFGIGLESAFGINTSTQNNGVKSKTAFDNSYFGAYGTLNLTNAFLGFSCEPRPFTVDALLGIG